MENRIALTNNEMNSPGVTVVVPVYNDQSHIGFLLESLLAQDYPRNRVEILVVDNNSTDGSRDIVRRYPVRLLEERDVQSSYAARNRGIRAASYDILAFIDSDCTADPAWLTEGIRALRSDKTDLAGGKVEFTFSSENPTAAELYDSITHMQTSRQIRERQSAATANLFVFKKVFDKIGLFPKVKSGGDTTWTVLASKKGFRLVYAPAAVVRHPARNLRELLKKEIRTGRGYVHYRLAQGHSRVHEFFYLPYWFICAFFSTVQVQQQTEEERREYLKKKYWKIACIAWTCRGVHRWGSLVEYLSILMGRIASHG